MPLSDVLWAVLPEPVNALKRSWILWREATACRIILISLRGLRLEIRGVLSYRSREKVPEIAKELEVFVTPSPNPFPLSLRSRPSLPLKLYIVPHLTVIDFQE